MGAAICIRSFIVGVTETRYRSVVTHETGSLEGTTRRSSLSYSPTDALALMSLIVTRWGLLSLSSVRDANPTRSLSQGIQVFFDATCSPQTLFSVFFSTP